MRILFAGTPALALSTLDSLYSSSHKVVGVLTASDKKSGRGQKLKASSIKEWATQKKLKVLSPVTLKDSKVLEEVKSLKADVMVVFAYGKIFRQEFLDLFPYGAINIHPSLLPRHRGPSPLVATILALDKVAGISIQRMALKMDTGNILLQVQKKLNGQETIEELMQWVSSCVGELVLKALVLLQEGAVGQVQNEEEATYCHMLDKSMSYLNVDESPELFVARVRALNPFLSTKLLMNARLPVIIRCACVIQEPVQAGKKGEVLACDPQKGILLRVGEGLVGLLTLQREGKKACSAREFWNSLKDKDKRGLYFSSFSNSKGEI